MSKTEPEAIAAGDVFTEPVTGVEFSWIPPGTFVMGDTLDAGFGNEKPVHEVTLTRGFWLGKHPVTQRQWKKIMGDNPSTLHKSDSSNDCQKFLEKLKNKNIVSPQDDDGDQYPVESVSWNDCQRFIEKLNSDNKGAYRFALPTEAQWEYAARSGGQQEKYAGGDKLENAGWFFDNSSNITCKVGQKAPNGLGLFDMSGNVFEWCSDWDGEYSSSSATDPEGPASGQTRIFRGGSWGSSASHCRTSFRYGDEPDTRDINVGLRLAML